MLGGHLLRALTDLWHVVRLARVRLETSVPATAVVGYVAPVAGMLASTPVIVKDWEVPTTRRSPNV